MRIPDDDMRKKNKPSRSRQRRAKARKRPQRPAGPIQLITLPLDGRDTHGARDHDCPICRAMAELGLTPDDNGVTPMTTEQMAAYQAKLAELSIEDVELGGEPEDDEDDEQALVEFLEGLQRLQTQLLSVVSKPRSDPN